MDLLQDLMKRKAMEIDKNKLDRKEGNRGAGGYNPAPSSGYGDSTPSYTQPTVRLYLNPVDRSAYISLRVYERVISQSLNLLAWWQFRA